MHKIKTLFVLAGCFIIPLQANDTRHQRVPIKHKTNNFKAQHRKFKAQHRTLTVEWAKKGMEYDQKAEFSYSRLTEQRAKRLTTSILKKAGPGTIILSKSRCPQTLAISPACLTSQLLVRFIQNKGEFNK